MSDLQSQCELGQQQLMAMDYLAAEATLAAAAESAWQSADFDTLSRVYLPLQEARRQRRQRAGEGTVCLDLIATGPDDQPNAHEIIDRYPHGQLLIAGWANITAAVELRRLQAERTLFVETFLAAVYPTDNGNVTILIALPDAALPPPEIQPLGQLLAKLPPHSLLIGPADLLRGPRSATADTYAHVMDLWERLHSPFLRAADAESDPLARMAAYRQTIQVDCACELAHQKLAQTSKSLIRRPPTAPQMLK